MKIKPILFSTEMVQAILEGTKTQTRRILNHQPKEGYTPEIIVDHFGQRFLNFRKSNVLVENKNLKFKYGQPGDVLWVRETCCPLQIVDVLDNEQILYRADLGSEKFIKEIGGKWKPSIFMPKHACRIFLKVKSIRAERLQDISEEDAINEGLIQYEKQTDWLTAKFGFQILWEKINGLKSWNENPYVWVIEFERIDKPENFS